MRKFVPPIAVVGLCFFATHAFAAGGGFGTKTDPCALVTPDEVAEALGEPAGPAQNDTIGGCSFMGASSGWESQAAIGVDENPGRADFFAMQAGQPNMLPVEDVGDRAFAFDSPGGFTQVTVLKDETLLTVTVSSSRVKDRLGAATELARVAAERLGTEAALAKAPGLETMAGEWYSDAGDPSSGGTDIRVWVIEADGSWRMTSAPEHSGYLAAENDAWVMASPQEQLSGSYEIEDADHFSTAGDVEADWSRIPEGEMPKGVDPLFLGIWNRISLTGNAPTGPLEPGLVGYWQATGNEDIEETLVWRISDGGLAFLTVVSTIRGELSVEDGQFELEPEDGETFEGTYQMRGPDILETTDALGTIRWQRRGTGIAP